MIRVTALALAIASAFSVSACGLQGDLERPEPDAGARPAPRAGEGQRPGEDRPAGDNDDPVAAAPNGQGAVPTIPSAPIEGTSGDPVGRPAPVTPGA